MMDMDENMHIVLQDHYTFISTINMENSSVMSTPVDRALDESC